MFQDLIQSPIFALLIIIALGFMLGRVSIRGISLDVSAVIFIALIFGHYGIVVPDVLATFGMVIFIFTIGIQAGPGFFASFKSKGVKYLILAFVIVFSSAAVAVAMKYIFNFDIAQTVGLLTGALTSTPGLAAAKELAGANTAVSYGIAYPFGVIGVILFVKLLPAITRIKVKDIEENNAIDPHQQTIVISKIFKVTNSSVSGKSLMELKVRTMTGAVVSSLSHEWMSINPKATTKIYEGDLVKAVGYIDALQRCALLLGTEVAEPLPLATNNVVKVALVSAKAVVNTTLEELQKEYDLQCTVTCVRRSGIDIQASPSLELKLGDKLTIVGPDDSVTELMKAIGNDKEALSDVDLFPVATGIVLGMIFGKISIDFGGSLTFSFGLTGGVLLIALLL
ncbi:MAG: TrkA C-terminal domain-containing protein, partial [Rikenellaceae bacterium]